MNRVVDYPHINTLPGGFVATHLASWHVAELPLELVVQLLILVVFLVGDHGEHGLPRPILLGQLEHRLRALELWAVRVDAIGADEDGYGLRHGLTGLAERLRSRLAGGE